MQNFKIFLTAFITGLIVFGILAVLLIHFGFRTMSGDQDFDFGTGIGNDISDTYGENTLSSGNASTNTPSESSDNADNADNAKNAENSQSSHTDRTQISD